MRKSPFSTPRGKGNQQGFKWKSNRVDRGYDYRMNNSFNSNLPRIPIQNSPQSDDYIAFNTSSPIFYDKRQSGQFFGARGSRNGNFSGSPRPLSYNYAGRSPRSRNSTWTQQRMPRKDIHISQYVDFTSFLEDPWKDLVDEHNKSKNDQEISNNVPMNLDTFKVDLDNTFNDNEAHNHSEIVNNFSITKEVSVMNEKSNSNNISFQDSVNDN